MTTTRFSGTSGVLGLPRTIELDESSIALLGGRRRRAVTRAGAQVHLGAWVLPGVWTAIGAALSVEGRGDALRIGVQGRAIAVEDRTMPPARGVDVVVDDAAFDALRAALLPGARAAAPSREGPEVFEVVKNRVSAVGSLEGMKPWFATILFLSVVGPLGGMTIGDSRAGMWLLTFITVVAIIVGLAATIRGAHRPPAALRLEVGRESVVLRDPDGAIRLELRRASLTIRRGIHRVTAKFGGYSVPVLELDGGGRDSLRLGVWDSRFAPEERGTKMRAPRLLVSAPDWTALLDALELGPDGQARGTSTP